MKVTVTLPADVDDGRRVVDGRHDRRLPLGCDEQDAAVEVAVAEEVDDLGVLAGDRDRLVAGLEELCWAVVRFAEFGGGTHIRPVNGRPAGALAVNRM